MTTASIPKGTSYAAAGGALGRLSQSSPLSGLGYGMGARGVGGAPPKDLTTGCSVVSERPISREELVSSGSLSEDFSGGSRGGMGIGLGARAYSGVSSYSGSGISGGITGSRGISGGIAGLAGGRSSYGFS